ncbi:FG-GAP repeat domain-containing protein [Glycomyces harbinensis]|uniref:Repeat domain-containing protein n=1 Tax=Glycomyces harbinensis TaxID=58114 RepID=A0A1G6YLQ0_9ACTN|nr:VCBS repeat-containing protein [Glycomyces harbinensis]SDD91242.1 Repeat domain-containing protein [Glycomyces harbinensis]
MNRAASPEPRAAALRRTASASAAAFGLALLAATVAPAAGASPVPGDTTGRAQTADTASLNDFDGDGFQDLLAVRESDGNLLFYAGNGDATFDAAVSLGSGWGGRDIVTPGDLTGDGNPDLLARDNRTGTLYTYPGDGAGGFSSRITAGTSWNGISLIASAGDFNNDGHLDLYAVRKADWKLYLYQGKGNGAFGTRYLADDNYRGWDDADTLITVGDPDSWGRDELLIRETSGRYVMVSGEGETQKQNADSVLDGSLGQGTSTRYTQVAPVGDFDGDGIPDVVGIDSRTGELELHTVSFSETEGTARPLRTPVVIDDGWGDMRLASTDTDRTYDYDGNGVSETVYRNADGIVSTLGIQHGSWWPSESWGTGFKNMTLLETAGDLTSDGFSDLLARDSSGNLYAYLGDGASAGATRTRVGTGWNTMSAIVSGHDFNGDGHVDIIAREKSTGYLWLYPGRGTGKVGPRVKIGTGWNSMRDLIAVGDLDNDGHADLLAVRSSENCLYRYSGRGNGTLKAGVKIGCGFSGIQSFASVGDFNLDGHADWIARRGSDGRTYLHHGDGKGDYQATSVLIDDWTWVNLIA